MAGFIAENKLMSSASHERLGGTALASDIPKAKTVRDDSDGFPSPPSESQERIGRRQLRTIRWPVDAGLNTFRIYCKHAGVAPYPRIYLEPNAEVGVTENVVIESVASPSSSWQALEVSFTAIAKGVVTVVREIRSLEPVAFVKWDRAQRV